MKKTRTRKTKIIKTVKTRKNKVFTKKNYVSNDGMMTRIWGPMLWTVLHTISFNYPVEPTNEDKKHYKEFILNLQFVLPCKYCRTNLKKNLEKFPLTLEHLKNRESFSRYIYQLHEIVNEMLGKKSGLTYCDVRERYEHFRSRCTQDEILNDKNKSNREKGCTEPLYGKKAKCTINIVPQTTHVPTFHIDKACLKKKKFTVHD